MSGTDPQQKTRLSSEQAGLFSTDEFGEQIGRRAYHLMTQFYGGLTAATGDADSPENPPSLATCERSPTSVGPADSGVLSPEQGLTEIEAQALPFVFRL
ncbi:hypothetical protein ACFO0N_19640, partial [Halobium salinum]